MPHRVLEIGEVKLIVGLGNPGLRYEKTRHNAGFMAIDRLVHRHARHEPAKGRFDGAVVEARLAPAAKASKGASGEPVRVAFIKPTTFMNLSGKTVVQAVNFYKVDPKADLLVITDDLALPLGKVRIKGSGSAGGHNGLLDIARALGSDQYPRCRVGIDPKPPLMDQADWVLSRFTEDELSRLDGPLDRVAGAVEVFIHEGLDAAMNLANADPDAPPRPKRPRPAEPGADPPGRPTSDP